MFGSILCNAILNESLISRNHLQSYRTNRMHEIVDNSQERNDRNLRYIVNFLVANNLTALRIFCSNVVL